MLLRGIRIGLPLALGGMMLASAVCADTIHDAAKTGDVKAIEKLIDADGSLVNAKDETQVPLTITIGKGWTALHWASFGGHADAVELLIDKGANVNAKDAFGYTPLHFAADTKTADILVKAGARVSAHSASNGWTPLHRAAFFSNKELAESLLSVGADVNARDKLGNPALYYAVGIANSRDVAEALIAKGADVNAVDQSGWTPLHCAAYAGNVDLVKLLIEKGSKVNVQDDFGKTPLIRAREAGRSEVIKVLEVAVGK